MTTIYLVRHGQASFGAASYDQLSDLGMQQARVLGAYLPHILQETPYVVAGNMQRHQQTAQLALAESFSHAPIHTLAAWNEFNHQQVFSHYDARFAQPEFLKAQVAKAASPRAYLAQIFNQAIARWTNGDFHHEYDESWPAFKQRVEQAFADLCQHLAQTQPRYAVVFSSGGVIAVLAGRILGLSPEKTFALNWAISNCSFTTLRLVGDEPQLLSLNEHHYLKAHNNNLLTWI